MLTQIKNAKFYLQAKLGLSQRGAEMVEYAIVLACIAAVGVLYYATGFDGQGQSQTAKGALGKALKTLWDNIDSRIGSL